MRDRLDSSLKLWLSRGKQKDDLLEPGLHLAEGEKLVKDFGPSLNREQTDYVYASIAERNRRKQAQARIRYAVMAAISVLAIVAGFQWLRAERHRQSAGEEAHAKQALASEAASHRKAPGTVAAGELGKLQPSRASVPVWRVARRHRSSCACDQVRPAKSSCLRTILPRTNRPS